MAIPGFPADHSIASFDGLTATNAMAVGGIRSGDNLVAVWSQADDGSPVVGRDITDFTVGNGTLTAGTIDLSSTNCWALWTTAPSS